MSAKRHLPFWNSTESGEDVEGRIVLVELSPQPTPTLSTRESEENGSHGGVATDTGTSSDEEDEEESSEDGSLVGLQRPNRRCQRYGAARQTRLNWDSFMNKFRLGRWGQPKIPPPTAPRCECHPAPRQRSNKARNRLLLASGLTLVFMIAEIVGVYGGWGIVHHTRLPLCRPTLNFLVNHWPCHKPQWSSKFMD